jgi:hypothetical protein
MPEAPKLLVRSTGGDDVRAKASVAAYEDNPLIEACGPILDRTQLARHLLHLPEIPPPGADRPAYLLEHDLLGIWRMHVPSPAGIEVAQTLDCMIRQGYVHRRPRSAATNRLLHGLPAIGGEHAAIQLAAAVGGVSGVGKSEALWRALSVRPQMTVHAQFPGMRGPLAQLLWLKVDVPESGSLSDLAETLFRALDEVLGTDYWQTVRKGRIRSGVYLAAEWLAKVRIHFLGILVIDEVQNLFKVATKARRTAALRGGHERPELGVADDQALKFILTLTNTSKIPVAVAGTPDGIGADIDSGISRDSSCGEPRGWLFQEDVSASLSVLPVPARAAGTQRRVATSCASAECWRSADLSCVMDSWSALRDWPWCAMLGTGGFTGGG